MANKHGYFGWSMLDVAKTSANDMAKANRNRRYVAQLKRDFMAAPTVKAAQGYARMGLAGIAGVDDISEPGWLGSEAKGQ